MHDDIFPAISRSRGRRKLFKTDLGDGPVVAPPPPEVPARVQLQVPEPSSLPESIAAVTAAVSTVVPAAAEVLRAPITCSSLDGVFAQGGAVAGLLGDRYRPREGQVRMASLVRESLQTCQHAVIEAGTGIGKSFAYLIPILWSGAPAIVSTSNKALMNQLWDKDVPQLRKIAPHPFQAALLKGRSNYLCRVRLQRFREQPWLPGFEEERVALEQALQAEPSGDCERMQLPPALVTRLTVSSRDCEGNKCKHFNRCFYEQAKRVAVGADLVITNHALLCYNVLLTENQVLPVRPVLVVDEAHQLVSYAINALTLLLEHDLFWSVVNHKRTRDAVEEMGLLDAAREGYDVFFEAVRRQRPRARNDVGELGSRGAGEHRDGEGNGEVTRWALRGEIQEGLALWDTVKQIHKELQRVARPGDAAEMEVLLTQCTTIVGVLEALARPEPPDHIRYCDFNPSFPVSDPRAYQAQWQPLEVADVLQRSLFAEWPRVICTSATLGVNNDLAWFRRQVGVAAPELPVLAEMLASPFDYAHQMLVYTPSGLEPVYGEDEDRYVRALTGEVRRLLETSRGRALVLCTSRRRMTQLYRELAPDLVIRYPCYCQGELSQPEIIARFKADGNAIIFATRSFWEGIDIPGEALSLVILDKVPFLPFRDPIVQRHEALIRQRGGNPFQELQLGTAILNLRQGAGRLIRSETDRGVIALLDSRVLTRRYGQQIVRSLPKGCHIVRLEAVEAFLVKRET